MRRMLDPWREASGLRNVLAFAVVYAMVAGPLSWVVSSVAGHGVQSEGALVVVGSLLVGPVAAWGSAVGTVATDLLAGSISLETVSRVPATLLGSVVAYRLWDTFGQHRPTSGSTFRAILRQFGTYVVVALVALSVLVATEAWILELATVSSFSIVVQGRLLGLAWVAVVAFPGWLALRKRMATVEQTGTGERWSADHSFGRRRVVLLVAVPLLWVIVGSLVSFVFRATELVTPERIGRRLGPWATTALGLAGPRGMYLQLIGGCLAVALLVWFLWTPNDG